METAHRQTAGAFTAALRASLPALALGVVLAAGSGLLLLAALWMLVSLVTAPDLMKAVWALGLSAMGALSGALSSGLAHHGERGFAARLRDAVAAHLMLLPPSLVSRYDGQRLRRLVADDIVALHHMVAHLPAEIATFVILPLASVWLLVVIGGWISLGGACGRGCWRRCSSCLRCPASPPARGRHSST